MNINECSIRRATIDDMLLYFEWANDPDVRQNSFNQNPITLEEHKEWFQKKLLSSTSYLYILECNGKPAGQIRFDAVESDVLEIDFSLMPSMRGFGIGNYLLKSGIMTLSETLNTSFIVRGIVKNTNIASAKAFLHAGFTNVSKHNSSKSANNVSVLSIYELCVRSVTIL